MTRYWRNRTSGNMRNELPFWHSQAEWTEVQVVPLDAIVILDEALTPANEDESGEVSVTTALGGHVHGDREWLSRWGRERMLAYASALRYVEDHPSVDEAQVRALGSILWDVDTMDRGELARRLIATGKVKVTE